MDSANIPQFNINTNLPLEQEAPVSMTSCHLSIPASLRRANGEHGIRSCRRHGARPAVRKCRDPNCCRERSGHPVIRLSFGRFRQTADLRRARAGSLLRSGCQAAAVSVSGSRSSRAAGVLTEDPGRSRVRATLAPVPVSENSGCTFRILAITDATSLIPEKITFRMNV